MKLMTEVGLPDYPIRLDHDSPVLLMGSCFTENIGRLLDRYLFPVCINPFGVTYNPLSVKKGLEVLIHKEVYGPAELNLYNGLWFSFDHYTGFSSPDRQVTLDNINRALNTAKEILKKAGILILSWGTSWVYQYNETGQVVCNCHKIPAREFTRTRLGPGDIVAAYESLIPMLLEFNSKLKILYTVSPVRHWKDGAHGNQLSKSALLLAGDALQKKFPDQFFYFPSYEIVMDELRDYRFYAEDMLHTNELATSYIWEKFKEVLVSDKSGQVITDLEPLLKLAGHRPLNQDDEARKMREQQLQEIAGQLKKKYPELNLEDFLN